MTASKKIKLKFLSLYPNMMDLYGDSGNLQILKYRAGKRGIDVEISRHVVGDGKPDFSQFDLIFLGGGADKEQKVVAQDILQYKGGLARAIEDGVFVLLICGGFQLFGKYYKDASGEEIPGLGIFPHYTEASRDKRERCIGDIVIEAVDGGQKLVGFENHGGQTSGVEKPLGKVLVGNGNKFRDEFEGMRLPNVIGTYLHGPLLAKNPKLGDEILKYCLERKYGEVELAEIDDFFEEKAREERLEILQKT